MKKKQCIRDKRNSAASERRSAYQEQTAKQLEAQKQAEMALQKQANQQAKRKAEEGYNGKLNPVRERTLSQEKKSSAKAAGLKSTFILSDNELLMTAFGKGNDAIIEKRVVDGNVETLASKPSFSAVPDKGVRFRIDGRVAGGATDNPLHIPDAGSVQRKEDLIHARAALENRYFGQEFSDNIHIQTIYNILDIEKILAIHLNNIVYMLNNFQRVEGNDIADLVSYITLYNSYDKMQTSSDKNATWVREYFARLCHAKQLGYLNLEVVYPPKEETNGKSNKKKTDPNTVKVTEKEFFDLLYALGTMRQMLAHGEPEKNIYMIDGFAKHPGITALLDRLYDERIRALNNAFLNKAATNLSLMFKAFGVKNVDEKKGFVQDYYDFTVRKSYKNQGFSIKLLREHMTAGIPEAFVLRDQKYDTVRGKLYPFTDFAIFRYYQTHEQEITELVTRLRAASSEVDKDTIYHDEAARVWPALRGVILQHILPEMSGEVIKQTQPDPDIKEEMLADVRITSDATLFSKYIYMVTLFINGKEINDLLTTLIHKFESIAAFMDVMKAEQMPVEFAKPYQLFEHSGQVAQELRVINSFARMSKPSAKAKECMYKEAFRVLGIRADDQWLEREVKEMLDPKTKELNPQKRGLRNFIANNVIESDRFKYLVRYGNINKLKGIAQNRQVIAFVLKDIPDAQIERYYGSVTGNEVSFDPGMRAILADRLTGFSFEDISDVRQSDQDANQVEQEEKRQKQALVRLYLAVLYLALKNLVYINSRYFLAFHCVERDRLLLEPEKWKDLNKDNAKEPEYSFRAFAEGFLAEYPQKKRVAAYLAQNFANSDDWAIRIFRNKVEHLDAVRNADLYLGDIRKIDSWYDLYHYIIQRRLMDQFKFESGKKDNNVTLQPATKAYFEKVTRYGTCCKDFIKALCVPFAYNLPRYKNLCIDGLFDQNRPGDKGKQKNAAMAPEEQA